MCSNMHSSCHSLSDCTFLYKYGCEHPPFIKKKFVIELLVTYYIQEYYHYNVHCVMVAKTAIHCVMGRYIAWMWQLARHRPTEKSDEKVFLF